MDSWGSSREVEKVKPFANRVGRAVEQLEHLYAAMRLFRYGGNTSEAEATVRLAVDLLNEAVARGVKGKDAA